MAKVDLSQKRKGALIVLVAVLVAGGLLANALYEDMAGLVDWHKEFIGEVTCGQLVGNRAYIGGSVNGGILACLNSSSGTIYWRRDLNERIDFLQVRGKVLLVTSKERASLWTVEGSMRWDVTIPHTENFHAAFLDDIDEDGLAEVVIVAGGEMKVLSGKTGDIMWRRTDIDFLASAIQSHGHVVVISGTTDKGQIALSVLDPVERKVKLVDTSVAPLCSSSSPLLEVSVLTWACLDASEHVLLRLSLNNANKDEPYLKIDNVPLEQHFPHSTTVHLTREGILQAPGTSKMIVTSKSGLLELITVDDRRVIPFATASGPVVLASAENDHIVLSIKHRNEPLQDKELTTSFHQSVNPKLAIVNSIPSDQVPIALVIMDDMVINGINHRGSVMWSREEALAEVDDIEFVELPAKGLEETLSPATSSNLPAKFFSRLISDVKHLFFELSQSASAVSDWLHDVSSLNNNHTTKELEKDIFGFNQLAVIATKSMKVYALRVAGAGQVEWSVHISPELPTVSEVPVAQNIFTLRSTAHKNPVSALVTVFSATSTVALFNPITGQILEVSHYDFPAAQVSMLPEVDHMDMHTLVLLERTGPLSATAHFYPGSTLPLKTQREVHLWLVDPAKSLIVGFATTTPQSEFKSVCVCKWNVQLPEGEKIVSVAAHDRREVVNARAKVLGDRSIMIKYINWNAIAIATTMDSTPAKSGTSSQKPFSSVQLYVFDTLTGATIAQVVHKRATVPVHIAMVEHLVVYTFTGGQLQSKLASLELYEDSKDWSPGELDSTKKVGDGLQVLSQVWNFATNIKDMTFSITAHGITPHYLITVLDHQVYVLDPRFFDARRPTPVNNAPAVLTREEREEGLIPYQSSIPVLAVSFASYSLSLHGVSQVESASTHLESTSHILAFGSARGGGDMFYTRISPSGAYDMLSSDFNKPLICLSLAVCLVATVAVWYLDKKRSHR
ncbi:ER membrane protein complex subunit 1 [Pelomyxa schiedti]|nr:ER membrane protein complex subunit 1 [Pelomyxa schiedti]